MGDTLAGTATVLSRTTTGGWPDSLPPAAQQVSWTPPYGAASPSGPQGVLGAAAEDKLRTALRLLLHASALVKTVTFSDSAMPAIDVSQKTVPTFHVNAIGSGGPPQLVLETVG